MPDAQDDDGISSYFVTHFVVATDPGPDILRGETVNGMSDARERWQAFNSVKQFVYLAGRIEKIVKSRDISP